MSDFKGLISAKIIVSEIERMRKVPQFYSDTQILDVILLVAQTIASQEP